MSDSCAVPYRKATRNSAEVRRHRPALAQDHDPEPVTAFVRDLQAGIDAGDADRFNRRFADDVLWGSPFGAVVDGYETLHAIHERMFGAAPPGACSTYTVEHVRFPTDDVAIAYVRRTSDSPRGPERPGQAAAFDELALFVLVRRDGTWWLAAGQHTPDRRDVYGAARSPT
jgi:uncharacterized protein (TIGR02246 family)